jgi:hypothetical protein
MVPGTLRVINLLFWICLTWLTWDVVNPSAVELMSGIALNSILCLLTDYVIRVVRS